MMGFKYISLGIPLLQLISLKYKQQLTLGFHFFRNIPYLLDQARPASRELPNTGSQTILIFY